MEKAYKTYLTYSVPTESFNIMVHKYISAYFTVNYDHETSKYLPQILL